MKAQCESFSKTETADQHEWTVTWKGEERAAELHSAERLDWNHRFKVFRTVRDAFCRVQLGSTLLAEQTPQNFHSSSSPCEERVGRGLSRGATFKNEIPHLPSPLLHPMEEREKTSGFVVFALTSVSQSRGNLFNRIILNSFSSFAFIRVHPWLKLFSILLVISFSLSAFAVEPWADKNLSVTNGL